VIKKVVSTRVVGGKVKRFPFTIPPLACTPITPLLHLSIKFFLEFFWSNGVTSGTFALYGLKLTLLITSNKALSRSFSNFSSKTLKHALYGSLCKGDGQKEHELKSDRALRRFLGLYFDFIGKAIIYYFSNKKTFY